jgi:hypothetical protein
MNDRNAPLSQTIEQRIRTQVEPNHGAIEPPVVQQLCEECQMSFRTPGSVEIVDQKYDTDFLHGEIFGAPNIAGPRYLHHWPFQTPSMAYWQASTGQVA